MTTTIPECLNLSNLNLNDNDDDYIKNLILNNNGPLIVISLCGNNLGPKVVDALLEVLPMCKHLQYITVMNTGLDHIEKERLGKACKKNGVRIAFKKDW
jgi:Ran GTPase-activating protein (RanGAP) involved in mRNA processing and transport